MMGGQHKVQIDRFSAWTELVPLQTQNREVWSPESGDYEQKRAVYELDVQEVSQPCTTQENSIERANSTVKTVTSKFSRQNHRNWDERWPEIMLTVNSSVSQPTGYSPASGRTVR